MTLSTYNKKRDFSKTKEPKGKASKSKQNRFVVQYHEARRKHYDFRLEYNGVLISWAIPNGISFEPTEKRLAVHVEDHPTSYINFSGVIPKGNYGAGTVEVWDKGTYKTDVPLSKGLKEGKFKIELSGNTLKGLWAMVKMDEKNWLIIREKNQRKKPSSLAVKNFGFQLASLKSNVPLGKDWIYEIKYDGYRAAAIVSGENVKILSRNKIDITNKFEQLALSLKSLSNLGDFILDGEIVCFDENGKSNFSLLQKNVKEKSKNICFVVFDILCLNDKDLRDKKLIERKKILNNLLKNAPKSIIFCDFAGKNGKLCLDFAKQNNLEGIVAKNKNSKYLAGRGEDWQKIKCRKTQEFVIGGFQTTTSNPKLSALLLGYYHDQNFIYIGKVGTGLTALEKEEISKKLSKLKIKNSPFINAPKSSNTYWVSPKLIAQIEYTEITPSHQLRQASFLGLRLDKNPKEVVLEEENDR